MQPAQRILVTGAAGFIGSTFVRRTLRHSDAYVVSLDAFSAAEPPYAIDSHLEHPRHHLIRGDITDTDLIRRLLQEFSITSVVNFAAETGVDRSIGNPLRFVNNNVLGTSHLLDQVAQYWDRLHAWDRESFRFVQGSTLEVYGSADEDSNFTEETPLAPGSPYAASKAAADTMTHAYHRTYGMPTIVARFATPYGIQQQADKLIPGTIVRALGNRPIPLYGDGLHLRDWIHIDDICDAVTRLLKAGEPGETFNFGSGIARSNLNVVNTVCGILDELRPAAICRCRASLVEFIKDRPGHDRRRVADSAKARRQLDWSTQVAFESGLRNVVSGLVGNQDNKHEDRKRLPVDALPDDSSYASEFSV